MRKKILLCHRADFPGNIQKYYYVREIYTNMNMRGLIPFPQIWLYQQHTFSIDRLCKASTNLYKKQNSLWCHVVLRGVHKYCRIRAEQWKWEMSPHAISTGALCLGMWRGPWLLGRRETCALKVSVQAAVLAFCACSDSDFLPFMTSRLYCLLFLLDYSFIFMKAQSILTVEESLWWRKHTRELFQGI